MNNRLLLVMLPEDVVQRIMADAGDPATAAVAIDVTAMTVKSHGVEAVFGLSERHRHMFLEGLDMIGATLALDERIRDFRRRHEAAKPWLKDVARVTRARVDA